MKNSKLFLIFALFMVLLCCFSAVSASEDVTDDTVAVSDDFAVDEVIGEVDSNDESLSIPDEEIVSSDDSNNESLEINDIEEVDDVDNSSTALAAEENDDGLSGQSQNDDDEKELKVAFKRAAKKTNIIKAIFYLKNKATGKLVKKIDFTEFEHGKWDYPDEDYSNRYVAIKVKIAYVTIK